MSSSSAATALRSRDALARGHEFSPRLDDGFATDVLGDDHFRATRDGQTTQRSRGLTPPRAGLREHHLPGATLRDADRQLANGAF
jgi:hypothetical protein